MQTAIVASLASRPVVGRATPRLAGSPLAVRPLARASKLVVRAESSTETPSSVEVEKIVKDLQDKWDKVENKTTVIVYGSGAIVALWLASTVVSALNSIPLLPKVFELVGLGYTAWFTYRYLLFKSSREELVSDIESLKARISGDK